MNTSGDFSTYTLRLVESTTNLEPPGGYDPQLSQVDFSFKVDCPSDFDCAPRPQCPPPALSEPEINYLAKDYASFRRLLLDRLSVTIPGWQERNPADMQVMLVELLAYMGDQLSYYQDAVATEAYLGSAHRRVSIRRHARLLDYRIHDGCNARAWVCFKVQHGVLPVIVNSGDWLLTCGLDDKPVVSSAEKKRILDDEHPEVFMSLEQIELFANRNELHFYTWGDEKCCLPRGATHATLQRQPDPALPPLDLQAGQVLVFEELVSPTSGEAGDADPTHRCAVRLTQVENGVDPLNSKAVVEIAWAVEDALPVPLCVTAARQKDQQVIEVLGGCGNVLLADHGQPVETIDDRQLPPCDGVRRYAPRLKAAPLTRQGRVTSADGEALLLFDPSAPASQAMQIDLRDVLPDIRVTLGGEPWTPVPDLLNSGRFACEFVVETETDGTARLRFGDDILGRRPPADPAPTATYRVGNGNAGNIGAHAISRIISDNPRILRVWNPLPASGGVDPEAMEQARLFAPHAFRFQERAVTEADYVELATRRPDIQNARASMRWTGSWYTAFITPDRKGSCPVDDRFRQDLELYLDRYRLAGYDLEINTPLFSPLEILIQVCPKPGYFTSDVRQRLQEAFSNRQQADGSRGFFHPDNYTFGTPVYLSKIYETALAVEGVAWVEVKKFQRWGKTSAAELANSQLLPGPAEVVRLDNDPNFPENGKIEFEMLGGL